MSKHINLILETELTEVPLSDLLYEITRRSLTEIETDDLIHAVESRGYDVYSGDINPIEECGDNELREELESRGYHINDADEDNALDSLHTLYEMKSTDDPRFDTTFANMIYTAIGRIL